MPWVLGFGPRDLGLGPWTSGLGHCALGPWVLGLGLGFGYPHLKLQSINWIRRDQHTSDGYILCCWEGHSVCRQANNVVLAILARSTCRRPTLSDTERNNVHRCQRRRAQVGNAFFWSTGIWTVDQKSRYPLLRFFGVEPMKRNVLRISWASPTRRTQRTTTMRQTPNSCYPSGSRIYLIVKYAK